MTGVTMLFCHEFPARNNSNGFGITEFTLRRVGNPFARRRNFYRKLATIRRQSGNEKGGFVPRTQRSAQHLRSGALQSRGRYGHRRSVRSRFCEAALRKSYALHRARDTRNKKGAREGRL
jgi:hypothetical protein